MGFSSLVSRKPPRRVGGPTKSTTVAAQVKKWFTQCSCRYIFYESVILFCKKTGKITQRTWTDEDEDGRDKAQAPLPLFVTGSFTRAVDRFPLPLPLVDGGWIWSLSLQLGIFFLFHLPSKFDASVIVEHDELSTSCSASVISSRRSLDLCWVSSGSGPTSTPRSWSASLLSSFSSENSPSYISSLQSRSFVRSCDASSAKKLILKRKVDPFWPTTKKRLADGKARSRRESSGSEKGK